VNVRLQQRPVPVRERVFSSDSEVEMLRKDKEAVVREATRLLAETEALYLSDYRGLTVAELTELRAKLRDGGATIRVLKNTLARRAATDANRDQIAPLLSGPTAVTFCGDDPVAPAKALVEFMRTHPQLVVRGGLLQGSIVDADGVRALSALPPRDVLIGQLVGTMAAPLSGLVTVLQGSIAGLARALQQIVDQKTAAGDAA
jgi:large subunit ribosomal protein L10